MRMDGERLDWRRALIRYLIMLIPWMLALLVAELLAPVTTQISALFCRFRHCAIALCRGIPMAGVRSAAARLA